MKPNVKSNAKMMIGAAGVAMVLALALPARADMRKEELRKLEPGGQIVVEADAGSVEITGRSGSGAKVVITSKADDISDKFDISVVESPGVVKVTAKKKGSWTSWMHGGDQEVPNFKIEVPNTTTVQVSTGGGHIEVNKIKGEVNLQTSGGHLSVNDLEGKVKAETSGGHISLKGIKGDATVETSGGHIEADDVRGTLECETSGGHLDLKSVSGDIKASTSGGHISIENAGGKVSAETSGGSVHVGFAHGNSHGGSIRSSGGGIEVEVDPGANLEVDAATSGGRVKSGLPLTIQGEMSEDSIHGKLGRGGELLRLRTSAGSIKIIGPGAI